MAWLHVIGLEKGWANSPYHMDAGKLRMEHMSTLAHLWRRHGWLIIGVLWLAALLLAFIGFGRNAAATGQSLTLFDRVYLTFQLIPMNSGAVTGPVGWDLQVGRFLIPLLAAWTALRALLSVFHDRWQRFLLRFWRGHAIICGLSRKGWLLAQGFAAQGNRVVVIEADGEHDLIGPCRERGIVVLVGDATNPDLLRGAGILAAGQLVAVTDDDGVNAEIAVRGQGLLRQAALSGHVRSRPLTCTVHLVDPQLYELARTREMALEEGVPLRLELFNVFERGARLLWSRFGPDRGGTGAAPTVDEQADQCSAHVLVIGLGRLGESLAIYAARGLAHAAAPVTMRSRGPVGHHSNRPRGRLEVPCAGRALSSTGGRLRSDPCEDERPLARVLRRRLPGRQR